MMYKDVRRKRKLKNAYALLLAFCLFCAGFVAMRPVHVAAAKNAQSIILKHTKGKDEKDVARIRKLLQKQKARGVDVSRYLDLQNENAYGWSDGKLTSLVIDSLKGDVTLKGFQSLTEIDVSYYSEGGRSRGTLTGLTVSDCPNTTKLSCSGLQLTDLDVSNLTNLTELSCHDNQIKKLDVRALTNLTYLGCGNNRLKKLDLSSQTKLTSLSCFGNKLTALDVGGQTKMTILDCSVNRLTDLDVSGLTELEWLHCYGNRLKKLDVKKLTKLSGIWADNDVKIPGRPLKNGEWVKD